MVELINVIVAAVCNCFLYCRMCGKKMTPYRPKQDLTPSTYEPIESEEAIGYIEKPIDIFYCPDCECYSVQKPVEVRLT